jgi:NAD(P)-dependent dehydrogenase (short-subunit alcohol dehydrogenase family)
MSDKLFDMEGRTALVTGAGGVLGRRSALVLGRYGARVVLADCPEARDALEASRAELSDEGILADSIICDVSDEESVEHAVAGAAPREPLSILVNAAGVMLRRGVVETSLAEWRHVVDVNLTGTWLANRAAVRSMALAGRGKIVNFASVYAERVGPVPESAYYATKSAIANVTRSIASEFGPQGIMANCLALGVFYPTGMTGSLGESPEMMSWFQERTMLKRLGDPSKDLDGPLALLASSASDYMTGQVIYVDGGWSAW